MATASAPTTIQIKHHPILLLRWCWRPALLMLVAAFAAVAVATVSDAPGRLLAGWLLRAIFLAFAGGGAWAAWCYLDWGYDALFLTERRLIERAGIPRISERRRELTLERIQSVEVRQRNPLMRWCGCGDLVVDVAGAGPLRFEAAREVFALRAILQERVAVRREVDHAVTEAEVRDAVRGLLEPEERTPVYAPEESPAPAPGAAATSPRRARRPRFGRRFDGVVWRRHGWFLLRGALAPVALAALAFATPFLLDALRLGPLLRYAGFLAFCELLAAGGWFAWRWADWRNDHYVVTPDRLIEIEQLPLGLRQQISEAALIRVQDIRYRIPNPLAQLLDYGDVAVHTAGETAPFLFRGIARPRELAEAIDRHVASFRLAEEAARHRELREEFAHWLSAYEDLRGPALARPHDHGDPDSAPLPRGSAPPAPQ